MEHASDCALHNMPAYDRGECDCRTPDRNHRAEARAETVSEIIDRVLQDVLVASYRNREMAVGLRDRLLGCAGAECGYDAEQPSSPGLLPTIEDHLREILRREEGASAVLGTLIKEVGA